MTPTEQRIREKLPQGCYWYDPPGSRSEAEWQMADEDVEALLSELEKVRQEHQQQAVLLDKLRRVTDASELFVRLHRQTGEYDALAYSILADEVDALERDEQTERA